MSPTLLPTRLLTASLGRGFRLYCRSDRDSRPALSFCTKTEIQELLFVLNAQHRTNLKRNRARVVSLQFSDVFVYGKPRPGFPKGGTLLILSSTDYRRNLYFGLTGTYYDKDLPNRSSVTTPCMRRESELVPACRSLPRPIRTQNGPSFPVSSCLSTDPLCWRCFRRI